MEFDRYNKAVWSQHVVILHIWWQHVLDDTYLATSDLYTN